MSIGKRAPLKVFSAWITKPLGQPTSVQPASQPLQSQTDLQLHITDLQAKVEKDFRISLLRWIGRRRKARDAVTKIVEEAFTSQYQDRAPPFTDAQQASIISSVVENIFKERIQQAPSPKSLIQTKPQSNSIRAFAGSVMRAIFGEAMALNPAEIQKKAELEALQKSAGEGWRFCSKMPTKNFLSEVL